MLIFLVLLATPQDNTAPPPGAPPSTQDEIRVIGRKLRDWRGTLKLGDHATPCVTKRSTGDAQIDQIGCDAMTACVPAFEAELKDSYTGKTDKAARERRAADITRRMTACFESQHDVRVAELADRRAARRSDAPHPR